MIRVGQGWDIHRLGKHGPLRLSGVDVPFDRSLIGHSDGDVVLHAVADALLGAMGAGDLGTNFPDSDPRYRGIDSAHLLEQVVSMLSSRYQTIGNMDVTILAERPKLAPYVPVMRQRLATLLRITPDQISLKAKTLEGLDAIGRGEAIATLVIVLLSSLEK